ncbi:hypothetical protein [Clostridium lacusfryxellense]|uniref:hypothetical protein n=1 Tax=Clostridium lacusfryxellense TaxID=205328 RepID=UPI001C0E2EBE|nr:hypothetical protein [Clostridium lacusfryxellense]MBU3112724.1 hypothetical protein [Clostridium lacusfryxellense]
MGLFNKIFKRKDKKAIMGWRFIKYTDGNKAIMFVIEPMVGVPDLVYLPDEESWKNYAPNWAKNNYSEIISYIKLIPWNRKLQWNITPTCSIPDYNDNSDAAAPGSLESTSGGRQMENENLFKPGGVINHQQAHVIWERLETRFAQQAQGEVKLFVNDIIPKSVFAEVSLPALKDNPNIQLVIMKGAQYDG